MWSDISQLFAEPMGSHPSQVTLISPFWEVSMTHRSAGSRCGYLSDSHWFTIAAVVQLMVDATKLSQQPKPFKLPVESKH